MEIFGLIMVNVGIRYVPGTQMTSIFEGTNPLQNKAFSNQNKGHLGSRYIFLFLWSLFSPSKPHWDHPHQAIPPPPLLGGLSHHHGNP